MNGKTFDSKITQRSGLSDDVRLIKEAQNYFDVFAKKCHQAGVIGTFCIHRCLIIGVFGHTNTKTIYSYNKGKPQLNSKKIDIETLKIIGFNGRSYVIAIHDDHSLAAGVVENNNIYTIGDKVFQEDGMKLVEKIRKIGFLAFLASQQTQERLYSVLGTLTSQEKCDILKQIGNIKGKA